MSSNVVAVGAGMDEEVATGMSGQDVVGQIAMAYIAVGNYANSWVQGFLAYWKRNEHIDVWADCREIWTLIGIMCLVRFVFAGAYHKILSKVPCVMRLFSGSIETETRRTKFHENVWYSIWHTCSFAFTVKVLSQQDWSRPLFWEQNTAMLFRGWENHGWPAEVEQWYKIEIAFWSTCLIYLVIETIRKDFWQMLVHHLVTLWLLVSSYLFNVHRVGICVLIVHDIGDIFLYSAKSIVYLNNKTLKKLADPLFGCFVLAFFVCRLYVYPKLLVWPSVQCAFMLDDVVADPALAAAAAGKAVYMFPAMLSLLYFVQCLWAVMILKMLHKLMFKKKSVNEQGDCRSDSEMSDDEKEEIKQKKRDAKKKAQ